MKKKTLEKLECQKFFSAEFLQVKGEATIVLAAISVNCLHCAPRGSLGSLALGEK